MSDNGLSQLVGAVLLFIVLGALTGFVSRSRVSALRYWSLHPWRFFWLSDALCLLLLFMNVFLNLFKSVAFVFFLPLLLLLITSAIQGLRVSWLRSRRRAAVIFVVAFVILIITQLKSSPVPILIISSTLAVLLWIVSTCVAETVGKLKIAKRKKSQKVLKKNNKEALGKISKLFALKNARWTYLILSLLVIIGMLFYWYEYRPSKTRKECHHIAEQRAADLLKSKAEDIQHDFYGYKKAAEKGMYLLDDYEYAYKQCLREHGIEQ